MSEKIKIETIVALQESSAREDFFKQRSLFLAQRLFEASLENEELKKKLQELTPATMETE